MCTSLLPRRALCSIILVALFTGAATSQDKSDNATGEIRGTISVSASYDVTGEITRGRSLNRYETSGANTGKQLDPPYALSEKAVIYIESVPGTYEPPHTHPQLDQRDMVFRPLVLPILIGSTVDFPNSDPLFHNVFSLSQAKEFDLGRYPKGQKKSVNFEQTGVVSVYCEIHSYMFATILVLQNPYFAVPNEDGNFILKNVPTGTYQLSFWYGRKKAETKSVTVVLHQTATVNFLY